MQESASTTSVRHDGPRLRLSWAGVTDKGRFRQNNEDAFVAFTSDGRQVRYLGKTGEASIVRGDFVFAVSDGMGGAKSGEFASRIAVDRIAQMLPKSFRLSAGGLNSGFSDILTEVVDAIHRDIIKLGWAYEECWGMGATLSLAWITPGWMYFAHVGDSRIYHLAAGGPLTQVTHDHTQAGWQRRKGQITERQARMHPTRNRLSQSLGGGNQFLDPHIGSVHIEPGDRILLCSDGLIDGLWDHHIDEHLHSTGSLPEILEAMVKHSLENSGRDNVTAIIVDVQADPG